MIAADKQGRTFEFGIEGWKDVDCYGATLGLPMVTRWPACGVDALKAKRDHHGTQRRPLLGAPLFVWAGLFSGLGRHDTV